MLGRGAGGLHQNVDLSRPHRRRVAAIIIIVVLIGPGEGRRCSIRSVPPLLPLPLFPSLRDAWARGMQWQLMLIPIPSSMNFGHHSPHPDRPYHFQSAE